MRSSSWVRASAGPGGALRYDELRSEAPLALRPTTSGLHIVGTAASPVAADDVALAVSVDGVALDVRSVAATVAWRSSGSCSSVHATVGSGGSLHWRPEPLIATAGCDHHASARVEVAEGASLRWEERLLLGRSGEQPGRLRTSLSVDVDGVPLLRHALDIGAPGWRGPAVCGDHRAIGLVVVAGQRVDGPSHSAGTVDGGRWATTSLAGPGLLAVACAIGAVQLEHALASALPHCAGA